MPRSRFILPAVAFSVACVVGPPAGAQTRPRGQQAHAPTPHIYAVASLTSYRAAIEPFSGSSTAPGLGLGIFLTPLVSVEGEVLRPSPSIRHDYSGSSISLAGPGATREEIERMAVHTQFYNRLSIPWAGSIAVGLNTDSSRRVGGRLLMGLAFRQTTRTRDDVNVQAPPGHTLAEFPDRHEESRDTVGGPLLGLAIPVRLARSLAVVPQLRVEISVRGDHVDRVARPMLGVEWRF